jgi:hypothetical protein
MPETGFHEGELAVQRAAGVEREASRLAGMLALPELSGGPRRFLADRDFAVLTARDEAGRLWASAMFERPGFLAAHDRSLTVHSRPRCGDPLASLPAGQPVGLIAIEFGIRRRVRVNGVLSCVAADRMEIDVDQAYGNCPQYIQKRQLTHTPVGRRSRGQSSWSTALTAEHIAVITSADTFFLGTVHPDRGADASHRGGPAGFVRVQGGELWWPDYPGNNMFNSLGNLQVDPEAALLFVDFDSGATLHLSGTARVAWTRPGSQGDDGGTGRRVWFRPQHIVAGHAIEIRGGQADPSPYNPQLT